MMTAWKRFAAAASLFVVCGAGLAGGAGEETQRPAEEMSSYEMFAAQKGLLLRFETFEIGTVDLSNSSGRLNVEVLKATESPREAIAMGVRVRWSTEKVLPSLPGTKGQSVVEIIGEETVDVFELDGLVAAMKAMEAQRAGLREKGADLASMCFRTRSGLAVSVSSAEPPPGRWITLGGKSVWIDDFTALVAVLEKSREKIDLLRGK